MREVRKGDDAQNIWPLTEGAMLVSDLEEMLSPGTNLSRGIYDAFGSVCDRSGNHVL